MCRVLWGQKWPHRAVRRPGLRASSSSQRHCLPKPHSLLRPFSPLLSSSLPLPVLTAGPLRALSLPSHVWLMGCVQWTRSFPIASISTCRPKALIYNSIPERSFMFISLPTVHLSEKSCPPLALCCSRGLTYIVIGRRWTSLCSWCTTSF